MLLWLLIAIKLWLKLLQDSDYSESKTEKNAILNYNASIAENIVTLQI